MDAGVREVEIGDVGQAVAVSSAGKIVVTCLPAVLIRHAISWRYANFVPPLAVGIGATMGIRQLGSWHCS